MSTRTSSGSAERARRRICPPASAYAISTPEDTKEAGDSPGHPFRGNQYVDGEGSIGPASGDTEAARGAPKKKPGGFMPGAPGSHREDKATPSLDDIELVGTKHITIDTSIPGVDKIIASTCKEFGYDPALVKVSAGMPPHVEGPGTDRFTLATHDSVTHEITIWQGPMWMMSVGPEAVRPMLAHEIQHDHTRAAWAVMMDEETEARAADKRGVKVRVNGKFTDLARKRWPHFIGFLEIAGTKNGTSNLLKGMRGVSDYADKWIEYARKHKAKDGGSFETTAIHETLSEVARRRAEGESLDQITSGRPMLRKFYDLVEHAAKASRRKR